MASAVASEDEAIIADLMEMGEFADSEQILHEAVIAFDRRARFERLRALIREGEDAYARGDYAEWTPMLMGEIWERAKEKVRAGAPIPDHVRP